MEKHFDPHELETLANHAFSHRFNHTLHAYIDIADDLVAGTLLSQIIYWFTPDQNGRRKVKVFKDGQYWIAKSQDDWFDEIRITAKQYRTAIKKLEDRNLIIKKIFKFDGSPTTHIRPNYPVLRQEIEKWKKAVIQQILNDENPFLTKGKKPVKSSVFDDAEQQLGYLEQSSTLEPQGEAPNPLKTLDFYQRSKSKFTKGQNGKLQSVKNLNKDYDKDCDKDDDGSAATASQPWENDFQYMALRQQFTSAGASDIRKHEDHYSKFLNAKEKLGFGKLSELADEYIKKVKSGQHPHKDRGPQIVWFLDDGWQNFGSKEKSTPARDKKKSEPVRRQTDFFDAESYLAEMV
ncbi:hypothetical protein H1164_17430 [Thermoactinomyces daqus]|uniref:Replication protein n=1 Tax=Thermoactinomyces daqus TaxID=1329516 RepID=A0A7W1XDL7_9BACL|nr:hypothetical protein [Thermoactinomyces daqus]MBA4544612.1 hypothetical protein [Thermoactinomyces daqus]